MNAEIRNAIPKLVCGDERATAFMVSNKIAFTATHAIINYFNSGKPIKLIFNFDSQKTIEINAIPKPINNENWKSQSIMALELKNEIEGIIPLKCINHTFTDDSFKYKTFGYIPSREDEGTPVDIYVLTENDAEDYTKLRKTWNLDLKKDDDPKAYEGLSGGPLLIGDCVWAILLDETLESGETTRLAGVNINLYKKYLESLGLKLSNEEFKMKKLYSDDILLGIRSFKRDTENMPKETDKMLCFIDFFNGKQIKENYDWNKDILGELEKFKKELDPNFTYKLNLQTHLSIAFAMGHLCDSISGIEVYIIQNTRGKSDWTPTERNNREYPRLEHNIKILSEEPRDVVLVLGIRHKIIGAVEEYIKDRQIEVSKIINCNVEGNIGPTAIIDGTHAMELANTLSGILNEGRDTKEKRNKLHIFAACPVGFMFYLGQLSRSFGKIVLYEFDYNDYDYLPSFELPI